MESEILSIYSRRIIQSIIKNQFNLAMHNFLKPLSAQVSTQSEEACSDRPLATTTATFVSTTTVISCIAFRCCISAFVFLINSPVTIAKEVLRPISDVAVFIHVESFNFGCAVVDLAEIECSLIR